LIWRCENGASTETTRVAKEDKLSIDASSQRYAEERRQGETIIGGAEAAAWGWSSPTGLLRAARRAEFLIHQAQLKPGVSCLELGCGTGEFTVRLQQSGCALSAVEISAATAQRCRERARDAEVIVGNIETGEGLQGRTFDAIVGVSVLHHVNMDMCLRSTLSLLKPGGRFAFSEPNSLNPQIWAERNIGFVRRWRHVTEHETAFRTAELRRIFETAGFAVDICEPFDFLHPSTPRFAIGLIKGMQAVLERTPLRQFAGSIRIAGHRPTR
jgi:SAM-dependent methyltransferase